MGSMAGPFGPGFRLRSGEKRVRYFRFLRTWWRLNTNPCRRYLSDYQLFARENRNFFELKVFDGMRLVDSEKQGEGLEVFPRQPLAMGAGVRMQFLDGE
jgi:hypothetical protein